MLPLLPLLHLLALPHLLSLPQPTRKVEVEDLGEIIRSSMKATGSDWLLPHSASGGDAGAAREGDAV